jgi:hypothetical protein
MGDYLHLNPAILMLMVYILRRYGVLWVVLSGPLAPLGRDLFLYVYGRFQEPPRPAGLLPGEPLPVEDRPPPTTIPTTGAAEEMPVVTTAESGTPEETPEVAAVSAEPVEHAGAIP